MYLYVTGLSMINDRETISGDGVRGDISKDGKTYNLPNMTKTSVVYLHILQHKETGKLLASGSFAAYPKISKPTASDLYATFSVVGRTVSELNFALLFQAIQKVPHLIEFQKGHELESWLLQR